MELKVEARNVKLHQSWQNKIEDEKQKLLRHYPSFVLHLRVSIEATSSHKESGFTIKLIAGIPQDTVVVTRNAESAKAALTESFDVLALQLKEIQRKKRKNKKRLTETSSDSSGLIKILFPKESYGFIITPDKREIYFHKNALQKITIEELKEGDSVIFGESMGDNGPQASWVRTVS